MEKKIFSRPVIFVLLVYVFFIIISDRLGFFLPGKNSCLINYTEHKQVTLIGKIISVPVKKSKNQQYVLEVFEINETKMKKEKTLVYANKNCEIKYGDIVFLTGKLNVPLKPTFPHVFDYRLYLQREKIYTTFYQRSFELVEEKPSKIRRLSFEIKNGIEAKIDEYFKFPYSSILKSMITGDKDALDKDIKEDFINTGLIHILVISGLHIGFCAAIFVFVFKLFGLKLNYVYFLTVPALFFYAFLTGANPPAVRASIMASCVLISLMSGRQPLIYNALALSALIIFIINPQSLFTASFQLSFTATLGIVYLYPKFVYAFGKIRNRFLKYLWDITCVTLSAQFAIVPLLAFYFAKISAISFILNVLVVPVLPVIITLSIIFCFLSFISSYSAVLISFVLTFILKIVLFIINFASNIPFSAVYVAVPCILLIFFYYFCICVMLELKNNKKILCFLFFAVCVMSANPFKENNFIKIFENEKNVTVHIKMSKIQNFIVFNEIKYDKYYFGNLRQYLSAQGINKIDKLYTNGSKNDFKNELENIKISKVFYYKNQIKKSV